LVRRDKELLLPTDAFSCSQVHFDHRPPIVVSRGLRDHTVRLLNGSNWTPDGVLTRDHGERLGIAVRGEEENPRGNEQQSCFPAHLIQHVISSIPPLGASPWRHGLQTPSRHSSG